MMRGGASQECSLCQNRLEDTIGEWGERGEGESGVVFCFCPGRVYAMNWPLCRFVRWTIGRVELLILVDGVCVAIWRNCVDLG